MSARHETDEPTPPVGAPGWLRVGAGAAALGTGAWLGVALWMRHQARGRLFWSVESLGEHRGATWAVVPGCLAHPDGRPSRPLAERLEVARRLWEAGLVERLLVSGVGRETVAMRRWLQARAVPPERVVEDPLGARTHLTMWRARRVFGVREAVLCTQAYHLPRALWLAERCGLRAVGVAADGPPRGRAPRALKHRAHDAVREAVARGAALADVYAGRGGG